MDLQEINNIFKEVYTVLTYMDSNLIEKIPDSVLKLISGHAADSLKEVFIDTARELTDQNISESSKDILAILYYNYLCDENEKDKLLNAWNQNENELKEKYGIDLLFKQQEKSIIEDNKLINLEKNFLKKFLNWLKNKIKRRK